MKMFQRRSGMKFECFARAQNNNWVLPNIEQMKEQRGNKCLTRKSCNNVIYISHVRYLFFFIVRYRPGKHNNKQ